MGRNFKCGRPASGMARGKAQSVHGRIVGIVKNHWFLDDMREHRSKTLEKVFQNFIGTDNFDDGVPLRTKQIRFGLLVVKAIHPVNSSEDLGQNHGPFFLGQYVTWCHPVCADRKREKNPQIDGLGLGNGFYSVPCDAHAVRIQKHDCTLLAPILASAPSLEPTIRVFVDKLTDGCEFREFSLD